MRLNQKDIMRVRHTSPSKVPLQWLSDIAKMSREHQHLYLPWIHGQPDNRGFFPVKSNIPGPNIIKLLLSISCEF